jgi:D-3-phosphoglycerate dehydrogenase / 2-oxoglutarate reductase
VKKIVITTSSFGKRDPKPIALIEKSGFEVVLNPYGRTITKEEVIALASDAMGMIAGLEPLTADVLPRLPKMKVISRCGSGVDNVDLAEAKKLNIQVFNTPEAPVLAVAELTLGFILNLVRKISVMDRDMHVAKWDKKLGNLLSGKKVGIIGYGRIGKKVAQFLSPFDVQISFHDSAIQESKSMNEILKESDIVTLHCSGDCKQPVLGKKEIDSMKKGALLINASRGNLIDEVSLVEALQSGHLGAAAIDVYAEEPYKGKLTQLENVLLTPHIGSYAEETRLAMELEAAENLIKGLKSNAR